jgi:hypothetical protein
MRDTDGNNAMRSVLALGLLITLLLLRNEHDLRPG